MPWDTAFGKNRRKARPSLVLCPVIESKPVFPRAAMI